nr:hypothetical protein [Salmonella enterica subsp. salamae]
MSAGVPFGVKMALSRPDVGFTLTHNGKRILHCAAGKSGASAASRLAAICGKDFADRAVYLEWTHHSMQMRGWVVPPQPDGKTFDVQYFFANSRAVRSRVYQSPDWPWIMVLTPGRKRGNFRNYLVGRCCHGRQAFT